MLGSWSMKKFLVIIVLGLMFSGNAYALTICVETTEPEYIHKFKKPITIYKAKRKLTGRITCDRGFNATKYRINKGDPIFENLKPHASKKGNMFTLQEFRSIVGNRYSYFNIMDPDSAKKKYENEIAIKKKKKAELERLYEEKKKKEAKARKKKEKQANSFWNFNKKKKVVQAKQGNEDPKITKAKKACKDLGFRPRSERFTDCALKLVLLDFERQPVSSGNKSPQIVIHKNQSNTNVWDELGVLFRQQGIIQDTTRPANTRSNIRCTTTRAGYGQVITNCR